MQPIASSTTLALLGKIAGWLICLGIVGAGLWLWYRKSDERGALVWKWVLSLPALAAFVGVVRYLTVQVNAGYNPAAAYSGVAWTVLIALYFFVVWRHNLTGLIANPLGAMFDGGNERLKPQAFYSAAETKRKRGQYAEAVAEIRRQLDKFPHDFTGQMLLAEIQAHDLHDLPSAAITIQRICHQPKHGPSNLAAALNALADWHLKYSADPDAARETLEKLIALLPDTEFALLAEQRIAHLASHKDIADQHERPRIAIPKGATNVGLMQSSAHLATAAVEPAQQAAQLVEQLQQFPHDSEAREKLAVIYAEHYHRLDLATDQLQQLINQPNQPARQVIRWLNLLADLQIRHGQPHDQIVATLTQIIERYPNAAAADLARNRIDLLRLELKSQQAPRSIKLGTYEQNIGLKQGPPRGAN
jgi:TolA-binding protein